MAVGEFFFVANKQSNTIVPYVSERGRTLGRKFTTRLEWMRREGKRWVKATKGEDGAVQGVGVYRVE